MDHGRALPAPASVAGRSGRHEGEASADRPRAVDGQPAQAGAADLGAAVTRPGRDGGVGRHRDRHRALSTAWGRGSGADAPVSPIRGRSRRAHQRRRRRPLAWARPQGGMARMRLDDGRASQGPARTLTTDPARPHAARGGPDPDRRLGRRLPLHRLGGHRLDPGPSGTSRPPASSLFDAGDGLPGMEFNRASVPAITSAASGGRHGRRRRPRPGAAAAGAPPRAPRPAAAGARPGGGPRTDRSSSGTVLRHEGGQPGVPVRPAQLPPRARDALPDAARRPGGQADGRQPEARAVYTASRPGSTPSASGGGRRRRGLRPDRGQVPLRPAPWLSAGRSPSTPWPDRPGLRRQPAPREGRPPRAISWKPWSPSAPASWPRPTASWSSPRSPIR